MKRRDFHTVLCAILFSALAGLVGCGDPAREPDGEYNDEGRIRELDIDNRTMVIRHRQPSENPNEDVRIYRTYKVAYDCRISTLDKPSATLADLREDDDVNVRYIKDGSDFILHRIKPD